MLKIDFWKFLTLVNLFALFIIISFIFDLYSKASTETEISLPTTMNITGYLVQFSPNIFWTFSLIILFVFIFLITTKKLK